MTTSSSALTQSTFASSRSERIIGRVFSLASIATSIETFLNAFPQAKHGSAIILYLSIGLIFAAQVAAAYTFWFGSANRNVYLLHGAAYAISFFLYPISVAGVLEFDPGFRPWLWWATGTATMAMGMYLPKWWSIAYLVFMPVSWFLLRVQTIGGSGDVGSAVIDATYIVLFAAAVLTLIGMIRTSALRVDKTGDEAIAFAAKRAAQEATDLERQKLDDLVHDQVLTTLLLAAKAKTEDEQRLAAASADEAIARLEQTAGEDSDEMQEIAASTFLESLDKVLRRGFPEVEIVLAKEQDFAVPIKVGIALSDATIQAITNSIQHAGRKAVREVRLKADRQGLKIIVKDNGRGFRESKIPNNRLGVRNSIRRRVTLVGGEVRIQSEPRKGATVVLMWSANA